MPKLFVLLVLIAVAVVASLALVGASLSQYLSALIAMAALVVSVVSAFKEDVFPFRPGAVFAEIIFTPPTLPSHDSLALLVPITFVNAGYGSGVIEGLTIKVESQKNTKIYTPVVLVDNAKFISGRRALHADNIFGAFNSFPLGNREVVKMSLLFTQEEKSKKYPFSSWAPDSYTFRLFLKHSLSEAAIEVASVTYEIGSDALASYKQGGSVSYCPARELEV